jgi:ribosomal protein S18 acetylase RimI-like enzyme
VVLAVDVGIERIERRPARVSSGVQRVKSEPLVRRATHPDIPAIRAVLAQTWRDTYGGHVPLEAIERTAAAWHAPPVLATELVSPTTFTAVAEDASGVVAVVTAHDRGDSVEIARLYVLPGAQRRGIGGRLLAAALAAFPARHRARLSVEEQNEGARAFYLEKGFEPVSEQVVDMFEMTVRTIVLERAAATDDDP